MMNTLIVKMYRKIIDQMRSYGVHDTQRTGMPTLEFKGQAFCSLSFNNDMVFQLKKGDRAAALKLKGSRPVDLNSGLPAKGWIRIPAVHAGQWSSFALAAFRTVAGELKAK